MLEVLMNALNAGKKEFAYFCRSVHMREKFARVVALFMCVAMLVTSVDITALAYEGDAREAGAATEEVVQEVQDNPDETIMEDFEGAAEEVSDMEETEEGDAVALEQSEIVDYGKISPALAGSEENDAKTAKVLIWATKEDGVRYTGNSSNLKALLEEASVATYAGLDSITVDNQTPISGEQHFTEDTDLTEYDMIVLFFPGAAFNNTDISVLQKYVKAGGRLVLHGENASSFAVDNAYLSDLAVALGGTFHITTDDAWGITYGIPNLQSDVIGGTPLDGGNIAFDLVANIEYSGKVQAIATSKSDDKKYTGIVDLAVEMGRLTAISDINWWKDNRPSTDAGKAARDLWGRLLKNSMANMEMVEEGEDPNSNMKEVSAHTHQWSYKVDENTIKAYCTTEEEDAEDCEYHGSESDLLNAIPLTLTASDANYSGIDNLSAFNAATELDVKASDVKLYTVTTEGATTGGTLYTGEFYNGRPTEKGNYYAELTVGDVTAVKAFKTTNKVWTAADGNNVDYTLPAVGDILSASFEANNYYFTSDTVFYMFYKTSPNAVCFLSADATDAPGFTKKEVEMVSWVGKYALSPYPEYTVVADPRHFHTWSYSATDDKLEAYCADADCPSGIDENHRVSLSLTANNAEHSSEPVTLDASGFAWDYEDSSLATPVIGDWYVDSTTKTSSANSGAASDGGAPVNVGNYLVEVSVGSEPNKATVKYPFEIVVAPVASVTTADGTIKYATFADAVAAANASTSDCEIKLLKDCSATGSFTFNNTNATITLNVDNKTLSLSNPGIIDIGGQNRNNVFYAITHLNLKGNGGGLDLDLGGKSDIRCIVVRGSDAELRMYDGVNIHTKNGGITIRSIYIDAGATAYFYGGRVTFENINSLSTIINNGSSVYIYGGEYHWDVKGTGSNKFWAGVTDASAAKVFEIHGGYFDGPIWWDLKNAGSDKAYTFYGGKYTSKMLKSDQNKKDGTLAWDNYIGEGNIEKKLGFENDVHNGELYNGTTYYYEIVNTNTHTITFNAGEGVHLDMQSKPVVYGQKYGELPEPTKNGYVFEGWYTGENGVGNKITSNTTVNIDANTNLYANWLKSTTIRYENGLYDGFAPFWQIDGSPKDYQFTSNFSGIGFANTSNYFTNVGYSFKGWTTTKPTAGSTPTVDYDTSNGMMEKSTVDSLSSQSSDGVVRLYAVWERDTTYAAWNGTQNKLYGDNGLRLAIQDSVIKDNDVIYILKDHELRDSGGKYEIRKDNIIIDGGVYAYVAATNSKVLGGADATYATYDNHSRYTVKFSGTYNGHTFEFRNTTNASATFQNLVLTKGSSYPGRSNGFFWLNGDNNAAGSDNETLILKNVEIYNLGVTRSDSGTALIGAGKKTANLIVEDCYFHDNTSEGGIFVAGRTTTRTAGQGNGDTIVTLKGNTRIINNKINGKEMNVKIETPVNTTDGVHLHIDDSFTGKVGVYLPTAHTLIGALCKDRERALALLDENPLNGEVTSDQGYKLVPLAHEYNKNNYNSNGAIRVAEAATLTFGVNAATGNLPDKVIVDGSENTITDGAIDIYLGAEITLPGPGTLSKEGYTFAGWNTANNGTGTNYAVGDKFTLNSTTTTLYAKWMQNQTKPDVDAGEGYTTDYAKETLTPDEGYEISLSPDGEPLAGGTSAEPGKTYYIRKKGDTVSKNPSDWAPITLPNRPAAPTGVSTVGTSSYYVEDGKLTGVNNTMEYSADGGNTWTKITGTGNEVTDLPAGDYKVRISATETSFASESVDVTIRRAKDAPNDGEGYTLDYVEETLTPDEEHEISLSPDGEPLAGGTGIEPGKTYYVRKKGDANHDPSAWTPVTIPNRPAAPTGLEKTDPSKRTTSDGKITGVDDTMEYSIDGGKTWKAVEPGQTEITGLTAGEIKIRKKAIPNESLAGEAITIILEAKGDGIYHVIYHVDENVKVVVDDATYVKGSVVQVLFTPAPVKAGYTFLGWSVFENAPTPTYTDKVGGISTFTIKDEDVNLYAVWSEGEDFAKAPIITEDLKSIEVLKDAEAELTIQAKSEDDGILSYAWYRCDTPYEYPNGQLIEGATENTFKVPTDIGKASYYYVVVTNTKGEKSAKAISKLASVYVEDENAPHFKVDFIINEDEICVSYDHVIDNALIEEPAEPDVAGFAGWYKDAEGIEKWNFDKDTVTAGTKLYAKQAKTVYVTYLSNGGQFVGETPKPVSVAVGSKLAEPNYTLTNKNHMVFSGWFKDIYATDAWDFTADVVNEDLTLYAGWGYPVGIEDEPELSVGRVGDYIYTGKQIKPEVVVSYGGRVLVKNVDYTVRYKNNVKVYTGIESTNNLIVGEDDGSIDDINVHDPGYKKAPTIIIRGKRNYSKQVIKLHFNIKPINLGTEGTTMMDEGVASDFTTKYAVNNKSAIKVKGKVTYNKKKLKAGRDYTLTLTPVDAKDKDGNVIKELSGQKIPKGSRGTFMLTVEGKGNYSGGFYKIITVLSDKKTLQKAKISLKKIPYNESGADLTVADLLEKGKLTVKVKGKALTYGTDYTVSFAEENMKPGSRTNGGVYPITIIGKGEYDGSRMTNAVITGMPIKKATITLKEAKPVYTGSHIGNNIDKVTIAGPDNTTTTLYAGIDYDAKVTNDIKAGTARVTITGKGIYAGSKKVTYKIQKKDISTDMVIGHEVKEGVVNLGSYAYFNGYAVQPKIELAYNDMTLIRPTDYAMTYTNNKKAGSKATATIKGRGNYTGTIKATFQVEDNKIDSNKKSIKKAKVRVYKQIYTGRDIMLSQESFKTIQIKVNGEWKKLTLGTDFEIVEESYRRNVDVTKSSLAKVTIHGIGEKFDGYKTIKFRIKKKDLKWWVKPQKSE